MELWSKKEETTAKEKDQQMKERRGAETYVKAQEKLSFEYIVRDLISALIRGNCSSRG
jgi:hypothetical protein